MVQSDLLLRCAPPQEIEAERAALGAMLMDEDAIDAVAEHVTPEDFYLAQHVALAKVIFELQTLKAPCDVVSIASRAKERGLFDVIGGASALASMTDAVPTSANASYYARIVANAARARRAIVVCSRSLSMLLEDRRPVDEKLEELEREVFAVTSRKSQVATDVGSVLREAFRDFETRKLGRMTGVSWGIQGLDDATNGMPRGELVVIAGRPAMGKSTFCANVLRNVVGAGGRGVARGERPVGILFTLEMTPPEVVLNLVCSIAKVDSFLVRGHASRLSEEQHRELYRAGEELASWPLEIDSRARTPLRIRSFARRVKAREGRLDLIVVDYAQLLDSDSPLARNRQEHIQSVTAALKSLAVELDVPILLAAQLKRAAEDRPGHKPWLSDLRESGALEQDAAIVVLLHREAYYLAPDRAKELRKDREATAIVAKSRFSAACEVRLRYEAAWSFFGEPIDPPSAPLPSANEEESEL